MSLPTRARTLSARAWRRAERRELGSTSCPAGICLHAASIAFHPYVTLPGYQGAIGNWCSCHVMPEELRHLPEGGP
jgi:hypothetical protein